VEPKLSRNQAHQSGKGNVTQWASVAWK